MPICNLRISEFVRILNPDELDSMDTWTVFTTMDRSVVKPETQEDWRTLHDRARQAAVDYGSVNLMLRYTELLDYVFL